MDYKYLPVKTRAQAVKAGLADKTPGGYGKYSEQYPKLERAMLIDEKAALYSCSWGLAQIMGFNHLHAGYDTVYDMIEAFKEDEELHLKAAVDFILFNHLDDELRAHNWAKFARGYNGVNYKQNNYDKKLAEAYAKWSRIKDTPYDPTVVVVPPSSETPPEVIVVEDNPPPDIKPPSGPKGLAVAFAIFISALIGLWNEIEPILRGVM
jgi:hypothetical protein